MLILQLKLKAQNGPIITNGSGEKMVMIAWISTMMAHYFSSEVSKMRKIQKIFFGILVQTALILLSLFGTIKKISPKSALLSLTILYSRSIIYVEDPDNKIVKIFGQDKLQDFSMPNHIWATFFFPSITEEFTFKIFWNAVFLNI